MKAFHTENYLGQKKQNYFEGWYFRHGGETPFSLIVGVTKSKDAHSFVQYIDENRAYYYRFPLSDFSFEEGNMTIKIGRNRFSISGIDADLGEGEECVRCRLHYRQVALFHKTRYAPSVMGPFTYLSMVCNHAVVSMRHNVTGFIETTNGIREIEDVGYIEKDFGSRFPENYVWLHAADATTSIMFAVAWPLNFKMRGYLCVVLHKGKQYNLSLYTGARLKICRSCGDSAHMVLKRGKSRLEFEAQSCGGRALAAPSNGGAMTDTICEDLSAPCRFLLTLDGEKVDLSRLSVCAFENVIART